MPYHSNKKKVPPKKNVPYHKDMAHFNLNINRFYLVITNDFVSLNGPDSIL